MRAGATGWGTGPGPDLQLPAAPGPALALPPSLHTAPAPGSLLGFSQPPLCWAAKRKISRGQGQDCGEIWPPRIQQEILRGWWSRVDTQQGEHPPALPPACFAPLVPPSLPFYRRCFLRGFLAWLLVQLPGAWPRASPCQMARGSQTCCTPFPVPAPAI